MFSRLTSPVSHFLGRRPAPSSAVKGVPELLAELAEVRAQKADLERREQEILTAARDQLLKEQRALEELKKKVTDCGIDVSEAPSTPAFPVPTPTDASIPASQPVQSAQ